MQESSTTTGDVSSSPASSLGARSDASAAKAVPWWHWHRRLYNWMLSFAHHPYAMWALALFSFTEAIFFPVPPFVLQIPMTLERRGRAWVYAGVSSAASVLGGMVGYLIGAGFEGLATKVFGATALHKLDEYTGNLGLLTVAAIAIHPYKLFTIAAGFLGVSFWSFLIASIVARSVLFFGIAGLLWLFGPPVRVFIEKYFNLITIVFGVLIVAIVVGAKML